MNVILIASYVTIPAAMSLISETNDDFLILTPDENIYELMSVIYDKSNVKLFEIPTANLNTCNPITLKHNIRQINNYKKRIEQLINSIKGCNVYFDLVIYCDFEFWIIKELSKKNKIFYLPSVEYKNIGIDLKNFKSLLYSFNNRIIYKTKLNPCKHGTDVVLKLSEKYFKDVCSEIYKPNIDYVKLSKTIIDKFGIQKKKVLILCGGVVDYFVNKDIYTESVDKIIRILIDKFGIEEISIKAHPRFQVYLSKENDLEKISPFLPAPFILNSFDIVIGYSSSAIHESSLMGKKVITLVKLLEAKDEKKLPALIEFIESNMDKLNPVYFPESFDELESLLNSFVKGEKHD